MQDKLANDPPPKRTRDLLQPVDDEARRQAKTLVRRARFAALGVIDPSDGSPVVSRVNLATDIEGHPVFLISRLSAHFPALENDTRASILVGEPAKGDPLAHARMTVIGRAERIEDDLTRSRIRGRFLAKHPKSQLYVDFPDFAFWRLRPIRVSLNGGFARAFAPEPRDLLSPLPDIETLADAEKSAVDHMNDDHSDAVQTYARQAGSSETGWRLGSIDAEGVDLVRGDQTLRVWFDAPLQSAKDLRAALIALAR